MASEELCDDGFCHYLRSLPEKSATTLRCFDRGDYFTIHGGDAELVAQEFFQSTAILRPYKYGSQTITSIPIKKHNAENFFKHFLLRRQYRVEVYTSRTKSGRDNVWSLTYKASPGNLCQFEDILFSNSELSEALGLLSLLLRIENGRTIVAAAFCDQNEQQFGVTEFVDDEHLSNLETLMVQMNCRECLFPIVGDRPEVISAKSIIKRSGMLLTEVKKSDFSSADISQDLERLLKRTKGRSDRNTAVLPEMEKKKAMECLSAAIKFLKLTNDETNFNKFTLSTISLENYVKLDGIALRALNLLPGVNDTNRYQSVYGLLNNCRTPQGQRLLNQWIKQPLLDHRKISERHDIVEALVTDSNLRQTLHEDYLRRVPDLQRLSQRLLKGKATLQDAYRIYQCVEKLDNIHQAFVDYEGEHQNAIQSGFAEPVADFARDFAKFRDMISSTLDMKMVRQHEFLVKPEFDETLTELKQKMDECEADMEKQLSKAARNLCMEEGKGVKLDVDPKQGYALRITKKDEKKLREHSIYTIVDSKNTGVRFRSAKLSDLNDSYLELKAEYSSHQKSITDEILKIAAGYVDSLLQLNSLLATMDVLVSFSIAAVNAPGPYVRPTMLETGSGKLILNQARHPCLEMQEGVSFIPNNVDFERGKTSFIIITGPNMGGKSTYIRAVGVITLMAQMGCFVPCDEATISIVDCVMARVGAADSQVKGVSTFLAEMIETATILRSASSNSLIIIDELGRGTSTFDGFGLAWGISEFIAKELRSFCLFATHFHELTELTQEVDGVKNRHVDAVVADNKLVLLYQVKDGVCDQSFGINVAVMAHFPSAVIKTAQSLAKEYEFYQVLSTQTSDDSDSPPQKKKKVSKKNALQKLEDYARSFMKISVEEKVGTDLNTLRKTLLDDPDLSFLIC